MTNGLFPNRFIIFSLSVLFFYLSVFLLYSALSHYIEKQPLPPGVTQRDADIFKEVQEKAVSTVAEIMNANAGHINLAIEQGSSNLSSCLLTSTSLAMAAQARCPSAIEFGQWHIDTWYSSPFPQEYAR